MSHETLIKYILIIASLIFILNRLFKYNDKLERRGKETILPLIMYFIGALICSIVIRLIFKLLNIEYITIDEDLLY